MKVFSKYASKWYTILWKIFSCQCQLLSNAGKMTLRMETTSTVSLNTNHTSLVALISGTSQMIMNRNLQLQYSKGLPSLCLQFSSLMLMTTGDILTMQPLAQVKNSAGRILAVWLRMVLNCLSWWTSYSHQVGPMLGSNMYSHVNLKRLTVVYSSFFFMAGMWLQQRIFNELMSRNYQKTRGLLSSWTCTMPWSSMLLSE